MATFFIASEKTWNAKLCEKLSIIFPHDKWIQISDKNSLTLAYIDEFKPSKIFFPHWSYKISKNIFENYECIVFHMTDLPFGRGGSPLQNLISRGYTKTKISALKVEEGLDTGNIYIKKDLYLYGTAEEIFIRANNLIENMIIEIIKYNIFPKPQEGDIVTFKRRNARDSDITSIQTIEKLFDYIRMLDAEGYPKAYIVNDNIKFEFSRASIKADGTIFADVKISKISN